MNLMEFVDLLDQKGLLVRIKKPVSVKYEIAVIMKKLGDKPVLFEHVKGYEYQILGNICSSRDLIAMGLELSKSQIVPALVKAIDNPKEPEVVKNDIFEEMDVDLSKIPFLTYYKKDGGPYASATNVIAKDPEHGLNMSIHRIMIIGKDKIVPRICERHLFEYLKRGCKEVAICIGNSMPVMVSTAMSFEMGKSELSVANAIDETKLIKLGNHLAPESEFVMIAEVTDEMHDEGPFVELTEKYDIVRKEKVFRVKKLYRRKDRKPMYVALLPAAGDHKMLMGTPREPTIFREVSKVCRCIDVLITPGGCSWLHAIVKIKKNGPDDGKKAIEAAFRGHASLKHVVVVDEDVDINNMSEVERAIALKVQGDKNVHLYPKQKGSSLDPSSDLQTRETCKMGIDATIPWGRPKENFTKAELPMELDLKDYMGG
jgi:2,5-furandicarboxylate decarboxylase 1